MTDEAWYAELLALDEAWEQAHAALVAAQVPFAAVGYDRGSPLYPAWSKAIAASDQAGDAFNARLRECGYEVWAALRAARGKAG